MKKKTQSIFIRLHRWRLRRLSERNLMMLLSILIGIIAGFAAVVIKNAVWLTQNLVERIVSTEMHNYIYFALPIFGISLTFIFVKYILRRPVRHGIPNVLHGISKNRGRVMKHNMFSSIIASSLTVGMGGSVGLEGPTVATGAAYGSWLAKGFRLSYMNTILLLACACAGAMAAIFKAPIAAIVFAVEVIMIDLTAFSLIPLLLASSSAVATSYFFLGKDVLYPFEVVESYALADIPFYIGLGILAGLVSTYFTKVYMYFGNLFDKIEKGSNRLLIGGVSLGVLIFLFPSLYGEGYEAINACLEGNYEYLFNNSLFYFLKDNFWAIVILIGIIVLLKIVATSLTFGSGGVGGIFAPTLFMGVNTGMFFALIVNHMGLKQISTSNFALIGMAGLIAGVLHAPLTGIFLIADISGGYALFVPLMFTATFAFITANAFTTNSVYHIQLARRKELLTHDQDKNILITLNVKKLIETNFEVLSLDASLRDLTVAISQNHRNLFPIVDEDGVLKGMVKMDDIRHLIFKQEEYDRIFVKDLMYMPQFFISPEDTMDVVAEKFESSERYNLAVIDKDGKYVGFISRANVFSRYRRQAQQFSHFKA